MRSLSRTLILGTTLLTAAVFVTAGAVLYLLVRMSLLAELDRSLADRAGLLASTIEIEDGKLDLELVDLDMRSFEDRPPAAFVQIRSAADVTLYRSPSLADADLDGYRESRNASEYFNIDLPDGLPGRAVRMTFSPRNEGIESQGEQSPPSNEAAAVSHSASAEDLTIVLAQSTSHIEAALARFRLLTLVVGGSATAVAIGALWYHVARSLRPFSQLAHDIAQVGENDLNEPIGAVQYPCEIAPVVNRLNQLLQRLDQAFRRERTMNANVAHELRNPLAGLRLKLDVAVSRDREARNYRHALDECRAITTGLQQMVDNLLALTRLDAGQFELHAEIVHVEQLVRSQWNPLANEAQRRSLRIQWSIDPELTLVTDATLLGVALRNLLDNAVTYADENGTVSIGAQVSGNDVHVTVVNTGSQLSQDDADNALAPFWQHDAARSTTGAHCGLGLSLVERIVAVLQGQLTVKSIPGGEFEITIALPNNT